MVYRCTTATVPSPNQTVTGGSTPLLFEWGLKQDKDQITSLAVQEAVTMATCMHMSMTEGGVVPDPSE